MIVVKFYTWKGDFDFEQEFDTPEGAFFALHDRNQSALAFPKGTQGGAYNWEPRRCDEHTLDRFKAILECCAATSTEYFENIKSRGLLDV